jgi:hypothetical protein
VVWISSPCLSFTFSFGKTFCYAGILDFGVDVKHINILLIACAFCAWFKKFLSWAGNTAQW